MTQWLERAAAMCFLCSSDDTGKMEHSTVAQCPGNTRQVLSLQSGDTYAGVHHSHLQHNGVDTSALLPAVLPCTVIFLNPIS